MKLNRTQGILSASLAVGLLAYLIGWGVLLPVVLLVIFVCTLPMPAIFSSWFSRLVASLLFLLSILQVCALLQFYSFPSTGFKGIAIICTFFAVALLLRPINLPRLRAINSKDIFAIGACVFFVAAFIPVVVGHDSLQKITALSGSQVIDSIAHDSFVSGLTKVQNLDYKEGDYYPYGFHIATAFIQQAFTGDINSIGWKAHAILYFSQYILLSVILCYILVYLSYSLLKCYQQKESIFAHATTAISIGIGVTLMHLFLFMYEGFFNYYYICATIIASLIYMLDVTSKQEKIKTGLSTLPYVGFFLLAFGASMSWPLFAPILIFIGLSMYVMFSKPPTDRIVSRKYIKEALPVLVLAGLNLVPILLQLMYQKNNTDLFTIGGALHNFNAAFLLVGIIFVLILSGLSKRRMVTSLAMIIGPFIALCTGLIVVQFMKVGEPRYYLIKTLFLLEMLFLIIIVVTILLLLNRVRIEWKIALPWVFLMTTFIVVATLSTTKQPLVEARSLFYDKLGIQSPPFLQSDSRLLAGLGEKNKIQDFNTTILHYDSASNRLFAHIQTASWANAMVKPYSKDNFKKPNTPSEQCFADQFRLHTVSYDTLSTQQELLRNNVKSCMETAHNNGLEYYIVTDAQSAPYLESMFGNNVRLVY